ncbi:flagellar biosynthetic protein FliO [Nocardioides sp. AE5]|uniref:FliO/MopB family protein n=1 Tax=Nocardioides sp. AE5 TaxID=2962573 RepID=UPI002881BDF6|nr:flagellar biosynthetic protein FliO [Nocardioides sp. AE5]MDT0200788.1 flagellar biosynthetic protein FliO [Nocardioides sp. AE5]
MLELTVRLVFSLAVVVGLLLMIARLSARRFRSQSGATITVVQRQALTRSSAVSVIKVGERVLVLGSTDQQVNLLAELDPDELDLPEADPAEHEASEDTSVDEVLQPLGLDILESPRTVPVPDLSARVARAAEAAATADATVVRRGAHRAPGARKATRRTHPTASSATPLAGSILSPDTWRQAMAALRRAS